MSLFDELYSSSAAPTLITYFSDERSVSIQLGSLYLVRDATGTARPERTTEEYSDDRIVKRVEMEIDLLRDQSGLPDKGLDRNVTLAKAIVNGVRWNIDGIENRTSTFVTLKLFRRTVQEKSTSGFRRQE